MRPFVALLLLAGPVFAGHSRHPYLDGGQSADGRYRVTAELKTTPAEGKRPAQHRWEYTWTDTKTGTTRTGPLLGLGSGTSGVFDPVHAHIFVAPDGSTFAVWNPNVCAPTDPPGAKYPADLTAKGAKGWDGFGHRLVVYNKAGEVVAKLDLKDFLEDGDWAWLYCYGRQVYWQASYPGLTRDTAPRVGYALYQISPDSTVLETLVGPTEEAARKAKEKGVSVPAPRPVRVSLTDGKVLDPKAKLPAEQTPGRPFKGELTKRGGGGQADYVPSLDPVRVEGKYK